MKELIKLLEQGEEIAEALKIGLAVKHMTSIVGKGTKDEHGQYVFCGEWDLLEYYKDNLE